MADRLLGFDDLKRGSTEPGNIQAGEYLAWMDRGPKNPGGPPEAYSEWVKAHNQWLGERPDDSPSIEGVRLTGNQAKEFLRAYREMSIRIIEPAEWPVAWIGATAMHLHDGEGRLLWAAAKRGDAESVNLVLDRVLARWRAAGGHMVDLERSRAESRWTGEYMSDPITVPASVEGFDPMARRALSQPPAPAFPSREAFMAALAAATEEANAVPGVEVQMDDDSPIDENALSIWIRTPYDPEDPETDLAALRKVDAVFQQYEVGRVPDNGSQGPGIWDSATNNFELDEEEGWVTSEFVNSNDEDALFWPKGDPDTTKKRGRINVPVFPDEHRCIRG